jgi:hypothetical protein
LRLLKLTNTADEHQGDPIYINSRWIVSIFPVESDRGGSLKTIIFGGPKGHSWEVEESPEKIKKMVLAK